ncbi:MAG: glycosyltransferase family 9 protein [Candidatus Hydrogenedentota bacterium]
MKILVIRFSSFGDLVLATGFLKRLKQCFIKDEVHLLTKDIYTDIFENHRYIDKIIPLPFHTSFFEFSNLIAQLKNEKYDLLIDIHNNIRSKWIRFKLRTDKQFVIKKESLKKLTLIFLKKQVSVTPLINLYFEVLSKITGNKEPIEEPFISIKDGSKERVIKLLKHTPSKKGIIIHPKSKWRAKEWSYVKYMQLINLIEITYPDRVIYLTCSQVDEPIIKAIHKNCKNTIPLCGILSINELSYLIKETGLLISGDTGIIHLARAFNKPQIIILGATVKNFGYIPIYKGVQVIEKDLHCRPCSRNGSAPCLFGTYECLESISVDEVFNAVLQGL